jgi:hypothetical protein
MAILTVAGRDTCSSDRTTARYVGEIWDAKVGPVA